MKTIKEINERLKQLETELATATAERCDEIGIEVDGLTEERAKLAESSRQKAAEAFQRAGKIVDPGRGQESDENIAKLSKREKICLVLGRQARNKGFNDVEKRALGTSLTTTAATFVEATSDVDGVNNAGVMISTSIVLDLLKEEGLLSPILRDVVLTRVPGLVDFPYRKTRTKANYKAEGAAGIDNQYEWDKLSGSKGYLQVIIPVTDEVKALTDFDFGSYIVNLMLQDISDDWAGEIVYGSAATDHIKGITYGATAAVAGGYTTGKEIDALITGLKLCTGKFRKGAKIYVAQDVMDSILFLVDDNNNFRYPVFNNTAGITSIGPWRVEVDEALSSGDFIIGNVSKYFKANELIPIRLETDRIARRGITEYIASTLCSTVPFAGAFIHGSKKSS